MQENNWKSVWEKRTANMEILNGDDIKSIVLELKRCDGFDILEGGLSYDDILQQHEKIKKNLSLTKEHVVLPVSSVYEVGGGSGANLLLFEHDGIRCGEIDYSKSLIDIARHVLETKDIVYDEAININILPKYDAVLSNSVFSYFPDLDYAYKVLEKMYQKANRSIGIIDIHDREKESEFLAYREKTVSDYKERYKGLPKLFYDRKFFEDFAAENNMDIRFGNSNMGGYWNNEFVFDCYLIK